MLDAQVSRRSFLAGMTAVAVLVPRPRKPRPAPQPSSLPAFRMGQSSVGSADYIGGSL
jgi:hypothetical protein